jgi:hypothetical protein
MAEFAPQYNLFRTIDKLRSLLSWMFWLVFILSTTPLVVKMLGYEWTMSEIVDTVNLLVIGFLFIIELIVDYILVPQADSRRRDDFIDNSFGSIFTPSPSIGYYDNDDLNHGIFKAAANLFENTFFTYSLIKKLTIRKTVMPAIIIGGVAISAYYGFNNVPIALSLLQIFFSMNLLGDLVKHCILHVKVHQIYDSLAQLFQNVDLKSNTSRYGPLFYRFWLQYEALHSRMQTKIPDKDFNKANETLTKEWRMIRGRYGIS